MSDQKALLNETDVRTLYSCARVWKNLVICTLAFTLNTSTYFALQSIQSSLYRENGLGTSGLSVRYLSFATCSLFLTPLMIKLLTHKWIIAVGLTSFIVYIGANGFGSWTGIIIASVIHGAFTGARYTAAAVYLKELARHYAEAKKQTVEEVCVFFFSVFDLYMPVSYLVGDLLVAFVFKEGTNFSDDNQALVSVEDVKELCGINDCPWNKEAARSNFNPPSDYQLNVFLVTCLVLSSTGTLLVIFGLDSLNHSDKTEMMTSQCMNLKEVYKKLFAVFKMFKNGKMWLLLPLSCVFAIISSFQNGTFNSSWVTCTHGMWMVGLVSIPGYIASVPTSLATSYATRRFGRSFPMLCSFVLGFIPCTILYLWTVSNDGLWIYFTIFLMFCLHVHIFAPILHSLHCDSALFEDTEAAFSFYCFIYSAMSALFYSISYSLCSDVKVLISAVSLLIAFPCYFVIEFHFMAKYQ